MNNKVFRDREILSNAHQKGAISTLFAFFRLSGPGWLQSAITLGGGSLLGALFLGVLGGTSMLWLQLVAIVIGVIMLSAISYVTLSTNVRPYQAINDYINPVLGVGWITATILANMIWILPQFSLCYDALDKNLVPGGLGSDDSSQAIYTGIIAVAAFFIVMMSFKPGWMAKAFDWILKLIVGMIVICFVAVVYYLATSDALNWNEILMGFIPNLNHWNTPSPSIAALVSSIDGSQAEFWESEILKKQKASMIGVTATAVGLNMTFLLPYSMLARGWDKPFRGLARFDLITAMAIPYLIVTTCIVIASAHAFHAKADANFLSKDPVEMQKSVLFNSTMSVLEQRYKNEDGEAGEAQRDNELNADINAVQAKLAKKNLDASEQETLEAELKSLEGIKKEKLAEFAAALSDEEKKLSLTLVKPNAAQLAATLEPLFGENNKQYADWIFGIGALGMGFSTIIILSLINGYAFAEIFGNYENWFARMLGVLVAIGIGFCWFWLWKGESRTWLSVVASSFGAILLPIAYISFFALMNNVRLLGDEKPTGVRMSIWNLLMTIGVLGALAQAYGSISTKWNNPVEGPVVIGGVAVFLLLAIVGFSARRR